MIMPGWSVDFCHPFTGLAPRIFFIFAPLLMEEGGRGVQRGGGMSLKSEEKGGKKGGGGVDPGKGSGAFFGGRGP